MLFSFIHKAINKVIKKYSAKIIEMCINWHHYWGSHKKEKKRKTGKKPYKNGCTSFHKTCDSTKQMGQRLLFLAVGNSMPINTWNQPQWQASTRHCYSEKQQAPTTALIKYGVMKEFDVSYLCPDPAADPQETTMWNYFLNAG